MKRRLLILCGLILPAAFLSACGTTSTQYAEDIKGYAVTQGRIVKVEGLSTDNLQPLQDGLATVIGKSGCRVTLRFDSERSKVFEVGEGVILVHGHESDYILEPHVSAVNSANGSP